MTEPELQTKPGYVYLDGDEIKKKILLLYLATNIRFLFDKYDWEFLFDEKKYLLNSDFLIDNS